MHVLGQNSFLTLLFYSVGNILTFQTLFQNTEYHLFSNLSENVCVASLTNAEEKKQAVGQNN